jgi:death on curing protein
VIEPDWIDEPEALAVHDRLILLHGGASGIRDRDRLGGALARPRHRFAYAKSPTITELAACYTAAIIQNHPFVDGNKRTGFVLGVLFLELNGCRFQASEEDAAQAVILLAAGTLDEAAFHKFLQASIAKGRRKA